VERYKGVDREKLLAVLREKYPDMPQPGTGEWTEFLKRLKEENPDDYRSALLLGGGVTKALEKEIQRSQRRDTIKNLFNRLFTREHRGKNVPDKRKIGLIVFTVVGGLFLLAFFVGTSPKKEATGGGIAKVGQVAASSEKTPETTVSPPGKEGKNKGSSPSATESGLADMISSAATGKSETSGAGAGGPGVSGAGAATSPGTGTTPGSPGAGSAPGTLPPPPAPVYYGGTAPPPPDTAYAATGSAAGQMAVTPPPMVIYADPGLPVGSPVPPEGAASQPSQSAPQATGQPTPLSGGMLYYNVPSGGMTVVTLPQEERMSTAAPESSSSTSASPAPTATPSTPYPQDTGIAPRPPQPPTGGNGW